MKTKTATWQYGIVNFVVALIMVFGLFGAPPAAAVAESVRSDTLPPDRVTRTSLPGEDVDRTHPYTQPVSHDRLMGDLPVEHPAYRPDRSFSSLEEVESRLLTKYDPSIVPTGISPDVDYGFWVDPLQDNLMSWNFPPDADITLTVGTDTYVRTSNGDGYYEWWDLGHDFVVGETITMTSGSFTKSHKVQKLALTSLDQALDIVKGTTKPGAVVNVGALDEYVNWISVDVTANTEGVFKAKMGVAGVDLEPGTSGNIGRWDSDGDGTIINWGVPNPRFTVNLNFNYVDGADWNTGNTATLVIDGTEVATTTVEPNGHLYFDTPDIQPGQVVIVSDGVSTKTLEVKSVIVTSVDSDLDTITGTAAPNSEIYVDGIDDPIQANGAGVWTGHFNWDLEPGSEGYARQFDDDDDWTEWRWYAPNPVIDVRPGDDMVQGWQFLPDTQVEISVGGNTYYQVTGSDGYFDTGTLDYDIQTGDRVVVSDGSYTKDHTVYPSALTGYDLDADTLTGIAAPNREVGAWACTEGYCDWLTTTTDGSGNWMLDFSGLIDIMPNTQGGLWQSDDEDDDTVTYWRIPDPIFGVDLNEDYIWSNYWASNTTITLNVDGEDLTTLESDFNGYAFFSDVDIQPGSKVTLSGGGLTKQTVVENLTLTGVDQVTDTVSGTADPTTELIVEIFDKDWELVCEVNTTADSAGNWLADFSGIYDIAVGSHGFPKIYDEDGDYTEVKWEIPMPSFEVNIVEDAIWGFNWTPGSAVTVTAGDYTNTLTADENGNVGFGFMDFDLAPGDYVEMTDGITTKDHTPYNLGFTGYDVDLDTLTGTADHGTWAHAVICTDEGCNEVYDYDIQADGVIFFDFSGIFDIQPGTSGWIDKWDDDGDNTVLTWRVPNPRIFARLNPEFVGCLGWPSNAELTLSTDSVDVATTTANYWGEAEFWDVDLQPGQSINVRGGTVNKTLIVGNVKVIAVDPDTNTVIGTVDGEGTLEVRAYGDYGIESIFPVVYPDGSWLADFSLVADLVQGNDGYAWLMDSDGDYTEWYWFIPSPRFAVNLNYDYIWGDQWEPDSSVTVNVRGTDVTTEFVSGDGIIGIGIAEFNIQPGDTVTVRDDKITKTLIVRDISLTRVDEISNIISGTAEAGIEIDVGYSGDDNYYNVYVTTDSSGVWTADFDTIGIDLDLGDFGYAQIYDEIGEDDGDYTEVRWDVYAPLYPSYEEKLITSKVTFDWDDVPDATNYKIQLSTKANFSTLLLSAASVDSIYPYATKLANNTTFYWRVKAKVGGVWGSWLPVWKFTSMNPLAKPVLQSPAHKETIAENTPTLNWDPVVNGVQYLVQISKVVDFSTTYFKATTSETEFETNPLTNGKYYWRVRALDASGGKGPWSEVRLFKIAVP